MITIFFGEGQALAGVTTQPLTQGIVAAFVMGGLSAAFTRSGVLVRRQHPGVGFPIVGVNRTRMISRRHGLPPYPAGVWRTVANGDGDDLPGAPTQGCSPPALEELLAHERHQRIHLQPVVRIGWQQRLGYRRQVGNPLFNPAQWGLAAHAENPFNPAQAHPLSAGLHHSIPLRLTIARLRVQHSIHAAVFAMVLSMSPSIRPIAYNILTAA